MTLDPVIQYAKRYGHFHNPDYPELAELQSADDATLAKLKQGDLLFQSACASVQGNDANIDFFAAAFHGRPVMLDGDAGPATDALLKLRRCDHNDFGPTKYAAAEGSGAWPSCDPSHPQVHSIRVGVDTSGASASWKRDLPACIENSTKISADIGLAIRYVMDPPVKRDVEQLIVFGNIPGNVIGWNYLPSANTCQQVLDGKIDNGYTADIQMRSLLWIHEHAGHGIGLPHTSGGIMNPSIIRTPISWRNDPSYNRLRRYYGGQPIDPVTPPDPPTPGAGYRLRGVLELERNGVLTGDKFVASPLYVHI